MNLKAVFILSMFINPFILLSQEEEKTPLWIEKGETIISIKPGAKIAIKEPQKSIEKIIKYVDVDHGSRNGTSLIDWVKENMIKNRRRTLQEN